MVSEIHLTIHDCRLGGSTKLSPAKMVENIRQLSLGITDSLLDRNQNRKEMDLVEDFAPFAAIDGSMRGAAGR